MQEPNDFEQLIQQTLQEQIAAEAASAQARTEAWSAEAERLAKIEELRAQQAQFKATLTADGSRVVQAASTDPELFCVNHRSAGRLLIVSAGYEHTIEGEGYQTHSYHHIVGKLLSESGVLLNAKQRFDSPMFAPFGRSATYFGQVMNAFPDPGIPLLARGLRKAKLEEVAPETEFELNKERKILAEFVVKNSLNI